MESGLGLIEQSLNDCYSNGVCEALDELPYNFTVTDPCSCGHPIVFASRGFLKMCGYSRMEVVGRNGRMFQGDGTCRRSVMEIREAVKEEREVELSLLNYRKDGTPFWMFFHMSPVFREDDGRAINFVAVQVPILRRSMCSRSGSGRNWFCLSEDDGFKTHEVLHGSCRREVCADYKLELNQEVLFDSLVDTEKDPDKGLEVEQYCEAGELEKQKAITALNSILSVLTQYSVLRGKSVSARRCIVEGGCLSSALLTSLGRIKQSFVLIDPNLPGLPIVYASDSFLKLTGYARYEVLGKRHRFLSCSDTDCTVLSQITESIESGKPCRVRILDYRKNRSSFWNWLNLSPIRDASGKIAYFVEVHMEDDCMKQDRKLLNPELKQLGAIAAVKVAVRSSSMGSGSSTRFTRAS